MSSKFPPDPVFELELLAGIADALSGNVISERESLARFGMEPDTTGVDADHDFDWTPAKEAMQNVLAQLQARGSKTGEEDPEDK